jgi:hypothetical protein
MVEEKQLKMEFENVQSQTGICNEIEVRERVNAGNKA